MSVARVIRRYKFDVYLPLRENSEELSPSKISEASFNEDSNEGTVIIN